MSRRTTTTELERPALLQDTPTHRYWGDRKPPKNRADIFRAYSAEETDSSTSDVATRTVATLRMYGPIDSWGGYWGISARDVSKALDDLGDVDEIRVRINSPGGDAWEGMAILNMLRAHPATVVAVVDGIAASAASYIACGADETVMSPGTQMMIHDASTFAYGPAGTMRKAATFLDSVSNAIASIYAEVGGGTDADWRALMVETTWYTAAEAVAAGLADRVAVLADAGATDTTGDEPGPELDESEVEDHFDLSMYPHAGRSKAPAPKPPSASAVGSHHTEGGSAVAFSDEQVTTMRQKLGIAENADEATILAALDEALEERTDPPADDTAPTIPAGHVVIPAAKLADLEAGAALATTTAKGLHDKERKTFLDSVKNKYLPTSRAGWEAEYDRDEAGVRAHFDKAPVLIPTDELGTGDDTQDAAMAAYDEIYGSNQQKGA